MSKRRRVVVTGGGLASSLGFDLETVFAKLHSFENCVRRMDEWDKYPQMNTKLAAPVDFTMPDFPRKKIRGMGRVCRLALVATDNAIKMSGFAESPELTSGRFGIAYGSSMSSVDAMLEVYGLLISNEGKGIDATTYIRAMPQTCAANLEVFYGLTGRLITCNTANNLVGYFSHLVCVQMKHQFTETHFSQFPPIIIRNLVFVKYLPHLFRKFRIGLYFVLVYFHSLVFFCLSRGLLFQQKGSHCHGDDDPKKCADNGNNAITGKSRWDLCLRYVK